jgi:hypothetical protein
MSSNCSYITSLLLHLDMAASTTPPSDFQLSLPTSALSDGSFSATANASDYESEEKGVGLANLQLSKDRRRTIDLVNRLNNTG